MVKQRALLAVMLTIYVIVCAYADVGIHISTEDDHIPSKLHPKRLKADCHEEKLKDTTEISADKEDVLDDFVMSGKGGVVFQQPPIAKLTRNNQDWISMVALCNSPCNTGATKSAPDSRLS
ncbi:uncharacterized protein [Periplaneta americana]|uniref:uncharacterized protein isoform X2 n=1 Tax=Periplaneta americana TaxID=6978 RepID=UPI0037E93C1F